jgi:hypothetical protein
MNAPDSPLATSLCGILLRNPVIAASGTFGYGVEFEKLVDLNALGGLVVKGLSREPMNGNPEPRLWETRAGMINSVGLQNIGVRAFVKEKLPALARLRRGGARSRGRTGRCRLRAECLMPQHAARRDLFFKRSGAAGGGHRRS